MKRFFFLILILFLVVPRIAITQEYLIGYGDTLYVMVWGDESLTGNVIIAPDGTVTLPMPIGVIEVQGLSIAQAQTKIAERLSKYVINPQVTVSLKEKEGGFIAHITGEVISPSFYRVPENTTLQELITKAGGLTKYADARHININSQIVDFSKFLKENINSANPVILANDSILVPRIKMDEYMGRTINLLGCVQRPGTFDIEEPMTLLDIIALAGGFGQYPNLRNIRILYQKQVYSADVGGYLDGSDPLGNPVIQGGTIIFVPSNQIDPKETIPITVAGQIQKPGTYQLLMGKARLSDLLFTAGGPTEFADIEKIKIIRDQGGEEFNLKGFLTTGNLEENPALQEGDTVLIPMLAGKVKIISSIDSVTSESKTVNVLGAVRNPGAFQISLNASLIDSLLFAGGSTASADLERIMVTQQGGTIEISLKRILQDGRFDLLPKITSGDNIFVPEKKESKWEKVVRLTGQLSTITLLGVYILRLKG
ncbi:MAG: SLBB domain-containing protein [Candidatus Pacebacteria bacterium]|nr:SLBB domain-containing protein [Candidatus Paceibacterota bacterium]